MKNYVQIIRENLGLTQSKFSNIVNTLVKSIRNWEQNISVSSDYVVEMIVDGMLRKRLEKNIIHDKRMNI